MRGFIQRRLGGTDTPRGFMERLEASFAACMQFNPGLVATVD
jgi:hypothetical protein